MPGRLEVLAPGLLTTVQDGLGRRGWEAFGVPTGGAVDWLAALAASRLVGNDPEDALLEMTVDGPALRFTQQAAFALAGADLSASLDGQPVPVGVSWLARPGSTLAFGERCTGRCCYLAVAGGLQVAPVLGSRSTDLRSGFGGVSGRALAAGDRLLVPSPADAVMRTGRSLPEALLDLGPNRPVRVVPGPHVDRFAPGSLAELCRRAWTIGDQADRMGYRLRGSALSHVAGADVASLGLPIGTVQVPGDGLPIVLLADHQPTGGYTVIACVIRADLPLLAQRNPGDTVHFVEVSIAQARAALRGLHAALDSIGGDDATWAALAGVE